MGLNEKDVDLQQMVDAVWQAGPYKVIISNGKKGLTEGGRIYHKIVLQRLQKDWQAEKYTEKQVFHENQIGRAHV